MQPRNTSSVDYVTNVQQVADVLRHHQGPFVILGHENPDGDALGSVLGLSRALRSIGKQVLAPMRIPRYLQFLPLQGEISDNLPEWPPEAMAVVLDVDNNDSSRVAGADLTLFDGPVVNMDHHGTNQRSATALVVDPSKAAATEIILDVIAAMEIPLTEEIATPLMLGLKTDTGSFSFDSVSENTFQCAAQLRAAGARIGWLSEQLAVKPKNYLPLLREILDTIEFSHDERVLMVQINNQMLKRANSTWELVEDYIGIFRSTEGVKLTVLVKDFGDRVKLSMRSRGHISAQNVAISLGGGGHVAAAGTTFEDTYPNVRQKILDAITAEIERASTD